MSAEPQPILRIRLLGGFSLDRGERPVAGFDKARLQSLLAYLVLRAGSVQQRAHLAFAFWPDSEEKQALTNLRNLLHSLRQALPDADAFLAADGRAISWKADAPYALDVEAFQRALADADSAQRAPDPVAARAALESAVALYSGDLLPSLYDEWIEPERERLRLQASKALAKLIETLKAEGRFADAIPHAKSLIQRDGLSEASHQTLVELHALNGDRAAALLAYKSCAATLKEELGIAPGEALQALQRRIEAGHFAARSDPPPAAPPLATGSPLESPPDAPPRAPQRPVGSARRPRRALALAGAAGALVLLLLYWLGGRGQAPLEKSLAVLPFDSRSAREEDLFFTDGIHDELITRISRIQDIKTISRTSVMGYRGSGKNLRTIGRELGVAAVLEGGIQRSGDEIRVNVQLIDASTDNHLWARTYTRQLTAGNIFAIQSAIVEDVASSLRAILSSAERQRIGFVPTDNLAALEAYFAGKTLVDRGSAEAYASAIERLELAIARDPGFAPAYATLATAFLDQIYFRGLSKEEQVWRAAPLVEKALELDPNLGAAHAARGALRRYQDDWDGAAASYRRAIELGPNDARTYYLYGNLLEWQFRRPAEALELMRKAVELDPLTYGDRSILSTALAATGRFDEAREILESAVRSNPSHANARYELGRILGYGYYRWDLAIRHLREGFALDPKNPNFPREIALCHEYIGDRAEATRWLEQAVALAPESDQVNAYIGQIHIFRGEQEAAMEAFRRVPLASDFYGWALHYQGIDDLRAGRFEATRDRILAAFPALGDATAPVVDETNFWIVSLLAYARSQLGETDAAEALVARTLALFERVPLLNVFQGGYGYSDVCVLAVRGDIPAALAALESAVAKGYYPNTLLEHPELDVLRDEPRFQAALRTIESRLAEQRAALAAEK